MGWCSRMDIGIVHFITIRCGHFLSFANKKDGKCNLVVVCFEYGHPHSVLCLRLPAEYDEFLCAHFYGHDGHRCISNVMGMCAFNFFPRLHFYAVLFLLTIFIPLMAVTDINLGVDNPILPSASPSYSHLPPPPLHPHRKCTFTRYSFGTNKISARFHLFQADSLSFSLSLLQFRKLEIAFAFYRRSDSLCKMSESDKLFYQIWILFQNISLSVVEKR